MSRSETTCSKANRATPPGEANTSTSESPISIKAALEILWKNELIPQDVRVSMVTLIMELQHLAASCKSAIDRACILTFATYADRLDTEVTARAITKTVERHLETMESRIKDAAEKLSDATHEIEQSSTKLKDDLLETAEIVKYITVKLQEQTVQAPVIVQAGSYAISKSDTGRSAQVASAGPQPGG
ncbi:hypothetical protein BDY19DRAFT_998648 [Irpex rosettiformis]|uniref:Uncharacterized protein n=1 Tax=Irpex rosettiformis TaxID=378272 RepID=A0ACB8TN30_9APHY|nr:hypothetical protein BDY19DRAFT_998648 [Irpex rosettiformis]